jgi:hypothetical protein
VIKLCLTESVTVAEQSFGFREKRETLIVRPCFESRSASKERK